MWRGNLVGNANGFKKTVVFTVVDHAKRQTGEHLAKRQ